MSDTHSNPAASNPAASDSVASNPADSSPTPTDPQSVSGLETIAEAKAAKKAEAKAEARAEAQAVAKEHQRFVKQRRSARKLALQALFEIDSVHHPVGLVLSERMASEKLDPDNQSYLRWLVQGVVKHQHMLDAMIAKYAPEWPVDQLAIVDRNILRIALFEISSQKSDTPPKVAINEAVELAKGFGSDNSPRFINGVLGTALSEFSAKLLSSE